MMIRINICCTSRGYSEPSGHARLKQEQRSAPTTDVGSRSGSHRMFTAMMGRLRRLLQEASLERSKPKSLPYLSERNVIGQPSRIGTCRLSESKLRIGARDPV